MMAIFLNIFCALVLAGLIAVGINRLLPKRGNWLPVLTTTFVPPLLFITISVYGALVALGSGRARFLHGDLAFCRRPRIICGLASIPS